MRDEGMKGRFEVWLPRRGEAGNFNAADEQRK